MRRDDSHGVLGATEPAESPGSGAGPDAIAEARGLRYALFGFLPVLAVVRLATLPPGAPQRDASTGALIGNTPFMDSLALTGRCRRWAVKAGR